jgi:hypothetical protein
MVDPHPPSVERGLEFRQALARALETWHALAAALHRASASLSAWERERATIAELDEALRDTATRVGLALLELVGTGRREEAVAAVLGADVPESARRVRALLEPLALEEAPEAPEHATELPTAAAEVPSTADGRAEEEQEEETASAPAETPTEPPGPLEPERSAAASAALDPRPAPPTPPEPRVLDITPELISRLRRGLTPNLGIGSTPDQAASLRSLDAIRSRLGRTPQSLPTLPAMSGEAGTLDAVTQPAELGVWAELPRPFNHALTSWVAARARSVQDALDGLPELVPAVQQRVDGLFPRLSQHSRDSRPGVVHGLARSHAPKSGTWVGDAEEWQARIDRLLGRDRDPALDVTPTMNFDDDLRELTDAVRGGLHGAALAARVSGLLQAGLNPDEVRLVNLVAPHLDALQAEGFAPLRRAVRDQTAVAPEGDVESEAIDPDWPWFDLVRGRSAVIVGGDTRPEQAECIRDAFGFADVEWLPDPSTGMRRAQALTQRMRHGTIDFVIALRAFSSHKLTDLIFGVKDARCHRILADGYGVQQIRLGLERFLAPSLANGDAAKTG